jgi:hypothetical protein
MNWLQAEIVEGIQKLMALRLRNTPPSDTLKATAVVWFDVFNSRPITWDQELDTKRIKKGFTELCAYSDSWPSPSDFFKVLPSRPQALLLPDNSNKSYSPETKKMVDDLLNKMRNNVKQYREKEDNGSGE